MCKQTSQNVSSSTQSELFHSKTFSGCAHKASREQIIYGRQLIRAGQRRKPTKDPGGEGGSLLCLPGGRRALLALRDAPLLLWLSRCWSHPLCKVIYVSFLFHSHLNCCHCLNHWPKGYPPLQTHGHHKPSFPQGAPHPENWGNTCEKR